MWSKRAKTQKKYPWWERSSCAYTGILNWSYSCVRHPHLLEVICVCGYAFSERLNPLMSNDAFMFYHATPCICLPLSHLINSMRQYASDIKQYQRAHAVSFPWLLSFMLSLSFPVFFSIHTDCLQTLAMWSITKIFLVFLCVFKTCMSEVAECYCHSEVSYVGFWKESFCDWCAMAKESCLEQL